MSSLTLRFRLAGIPVQVDPGFWLIALLLGFHGTAKGVMIWVPAVFFGVLAHELGHALTAKAFGAKPEITLYAMGGLTRSVFERARSPSRWQSALVTLAGPGAGFVIAGLTFVFAVLYAPAEGTTAFQVAGVLIWINLGWGLINLLPVLPLDGGNLLRAILSGPGSEVGLVRALWVSVIAGPIVAIMSWQQDFMWGGLLFALFTFSSVRQLIDVRRTVGDQRQGLGAMLEQAHDALTDGRLDEAERLSWQVAERAKNKTLRASAVHLAAFVHLERAEPQQALKTLETLPPDSIDPFVHGACLLALDEPRQAILPLERAVEAGHQPRAVDLLIEALERSGQAEQAADLRQQVAQADGDRRQ